MLVLPLLILCFVYSIDNNFVVTLCLACYILLGDVCVHVFYIKLAYLSFYIKCNVNVIQVNY
jgi:hypothetical protein